MSKKAAKQQSFIQKYELIPGLQIVALALAVSYVWWQWGANFISQWPIIQRISPLLLAGVVVAMLSNTTLKNKQKANQLRFLAHAGAMTVALMVFWDFWHWEHLDSTWYRDTTFFTGQAAITMLFLSLACTPLITLFGWSPLNALKKPLGNYGFGFVALHLIMFTIDYGLTNTGAINTGAVVAEAILKRYALVGFLGFLLLIPLFATSNVWSQKRLGKRWKALHKSVYLINVLAVVHYIWVWSSKLALGKPIAFAVVLAFLLLLRVDSVKKRVRTWRRNWEKARRQAKTA